MSLMNLIKQNIHNVGDFDDSFKREFRKLGINQMQKVMKKLFTGTNLMVHTYYNRGGIAVSGEVRTVIYNFKGKDIELVLELNPHTNGVLYREVNGKQNLFMKFEDFCNEDSASEIINKEFSK